MNIELHRFTEHEIFDIEKDLECYICNQGMDNYKIYLFSIQFKDEQELLKNYEKINDTIAFSFQSKLKEHIEKWNVYLFLFVQESITKSTRILLEQDKYATRKIVIDNQFKSESTHEKIIKNKLFLQDFLYLEELKEIDNKNKTSENDTVQESLVKLRGLSKKEKKEEIKNYIREVKNIES